jgi:hypothetical protein
MGSSGDDAPAEALRPGRCAFFVARKQRHCKMTVAPGLTFCGLHLAEATGQGEPRVPCPHGAQ